MHTQVDDQRLMPLSKLDEGDHPIAIELQGLHAAIEKLQREAHASSVKLQHQSLSYSANIARAQALEHENARLREELAFLRAVPDISPHPATLQVQELTIALRRLNDKLDEAEATISARTMGREHALDEASTAKLQAEAAYDLAARARGKEEQGKIRERELLIKLRAVEEQQKMSDLVVQEYANLVRTMEGRQSLHSPKRSQSFSTNASSSSVTLLDGLAEGKLSIQKLFDEFRAENEHLQSEISQLKDENAFQLSKLAAQQNSVESHNKKLAEVQSRLDSHLRDDKTAAKMVSRYMKFSQSATDGLQRAIEALKERHAATTSSMSSQISEQANEIAEREEQIGRLRKALDDLSADFQREAYGWRREISLRLALLSREESIAEALRRWARKMHERLSDPAHQQQPDSVVEDALRGADKILGLLDGEFEKEEHTSDSVARIISAETAVARLSEELRVQLRRRLDLERGAAGIDVEQFVEHVLSFKTPLEPRIYTISRPRPTRARAAEAKSTISIPPALQTTTAPEIPSPQLSALDPASVEDSAQIDQPPPEAVVPEEIAITPTNVLSTTLTEPASESAQSITEEVDTNIHEPTQMASDPSPPSTDVSPPGEADILPGPPSDSINTPLTLSPSPSHSVTDDHGSPMQEEFDILPEPSEANDPPEPSPIISETAHVPILKPDPDLLPSPVVQPSPTDPPPYIIVEEVMEPAPILDQTPADDDPFISHYEPDYEPEPETLSTPGQSPETEALLASLNEVRHRYDDIQRSFRECHAALKDLKKSVSSNSSLMTSLPNGVTVSVLTTAVDRLNDFNEDARVELEIHVADEELVARGFETLLCVPGALSTAQEEEDVHREIRAFVDGTEKSVAKANTQLGKKLEDLQHDIACIKLSLHELLSAPSPEEKELELHHRDTSSSSEFGTGGWAQWIRRPTYIQRSPSPAPTFGHVMTTPSLRHSSSHSSLPRMPSFQELSAQQRDPFAALDLKVPMPKHHLQTQLAPPIASPSRAPSPAATRARTTSAMYMIGLGSRSSVSLGASPKKQPVAPSIISREIAADDIE